MSNIQEVSKEVFDQEVLQNELPVLVDFTTDGCGPCELVVPIIHELQEEYAGKAVFYQHNVTLDELMNESNDIAKRYDVMGFPTLMLFKNGEAIDTILGIYDKDAIEDRLKKVL